MNQLLDQVLPHPDHSITHGSVFPVPPQVSFNAALDLDILRNPFVRALVASRAALVGGSPKRLRLRDMTQPPLSWLQLAEDPGTQLVLGQVSRPWVVTDAATLTTLRPLTPEQFRDFSQPGYAKIAVGVQAVPCGTAASVLTIETRVSLTDAHSRRRFRRYWLVVRPFSEAIRRIAFRQLHTQLGCPRAPIRGEIEILRPPEVVFDTVADERNEPAFNPALTRVEKLTTGPLGPGTRFQAMTTTRGRAVPMTIEFTDFQRAQRLSSITEMTSMCIDGTLTFEPTPRGTRLAWAWDIHPVGALALARPAIIWLGRRQERRIWQALKRYLEEDDAVHVTATPSLSPRSPPS